MFGRVLIDKKLFQIDGEKRARIQRGKDRQLQPHYWTRPVRRPGVHGVPVRLRDPLLSRRLPPPGTQVRGRRLLNNEAAGEPGG